MNRKKFIQGMGLLGVSATIPAIGLVKAEELIDESTPDTVDDCVLIPTETAGPFPLDLTENSTFFRQDIREDRTGVQLNLKLKILGLENCLPMQNVRVNVWHCDKDGLYSGYNQQNNPGQQGLTYLRGYQFADADGEVEFVTIFPGWYVGRICHIHFQVHVSSSYAAISQLSFDIATKQAIYAANPDIYTNGLDPMTFQQDNIFSDGYAYQLATLTPNETTGGYDAYLEVTVQGSGTMGVGHIERENSKQFILGQNYPNPYSQQTTIPIELLKPSDVLIDIYDLSGRKLASINKQKLSAGKHNILLNLSSLNLVLGNYIYQVEVRNENGIFRDHKMMTAKKY